MKQILSTVAALVIVTSAAFASGGDKRESFCKVYKTTAESTYRLIYSSTDANSIRVSFFDQEGELVFSERLNGKKQISRNYNLSQIPDGDYTINISSASSRYSEKVSVGEKPEPSTFSLIDREFNKVLFYANANSDDLSLIIYDEDGYQLYDQALGDKSVVTKYFNFEKIDSQEVYFVVFDDNKMIWSSMALLL